MSDGRLHDMTWQQLYEVVAQLTIRATHMSALDDQDSPSDLIRVRRPEALGAKIYEYQYLENTFAATKLFYNAIGTPNAAYHDRPSAAGSSPGMKDAGFRPHDFSYEEVRESDVLLLIGTNPYENQSVFFMQYCVGKELIVIDPRFTATAQYAVQTGGLHVQPKKLGADSLVIYALAREVIKRWEQHHPGQLDRFPRRGHIETDLANLETNAGGEKKRYEQMRRASRAATFDDFAQDFLRYNDDNSPYTLQKAAEIADIDVSILEAVVERLFLPQEGDATRQPKVGILYEKGMIWGFNYHNTAAVASLGLLLGAYSQPGRFVGRVGGHQKGWAAAMTVLQDRFESRRDPTSSYEEGYPFRNAEDRYSDAPLRDRFGAGAEIKVHHNIDYHVFGVPPDFEHNSQDGVPEPDRFVRLANGLVTKREPDVRLLWIIGGNYLGQTNDAQRKRERLDQRLQVGGTDGQIRRPAARGENDPITVAEIVAALGPRVYNADDNSHEIDTQGIVLIHQDILPNPTTDYCDIVIPAAGWGEETFCRYNAQRRLKLYDRFQDMPLHPDDKTRLRGDPHQSLDDLKNYRHSPKPDWMIFRDIIWAVGRELDGDPVDTLGPLEQLMQQTFDWPHTAKIADEMAQHSNRTSILGDLIPFGEALELQDGIVHQLLGKNGGGLAEHLTGSYTVADSDSEVYGNGIATNGVILPVRFQSDTGSPHLEGRLRPDPTRNSDGDVDPKRKLTFVKAAWVDIAPDFETVNQSSDDPDELFITCGRFNHLWNNMFHHLRNDYVNERYPEDLPGTILEINPEWAAAPCRAIRNGDVVEITAPDKAQRFLAVASLQASVPPEGAFAMFSYPVRNDAGRFVFDGYVNNITNGYADGINPIAALKYGRGVVRKTGAVYQNAERLGLTYAPRNVIRPADRPLAPPQTRLSPETRLNWEMRELIVTKGLPRAFLRRPFEFGAPPHRIDTPSEPVGFSGQFWHLPELTPQQFLDMAIFGERVQDHLVRRLRSNMPSGMLSPIPLGSAPETAAQIDRVEQLLATPDFSTTEFDEVRRILDALIDTPHRAVLTLFLDPEGFMRLLTENQDVRERLIARLAEGTRKMRWTHNGKVIDAWLPNEQHIAFRWYRQTQP